MKTKMMMLALAIVMSLSVFAQNGQRGGTMTPEQRAERAKQRIEAMDKAVKLTAEEKTKVEDLFKTTDEQMAKLRESAGGDMNAMREKMAAIREAQDVKLKTILGEDRLKIYEASLPQRGQGGQRGANRPQ